MKIKRELKQLINNLNDEVYFTTDPPVFDNGDDSYWDCKYFIVWVVVKNILYATKSQNEMIDLLSEIVDEQNGEIGIGAGYIFHMFEDVTAWWKQHFKERKFEYGNNNKQN